MLMRIKKLTRQYTGHGSFSHVIDYTIQDIIQYDQHRQWCWETWGPSCELEFSLRFRRINPEGWNAKWAWLADTSFPKIRIYFGSEQEVAMFILRWS